MANLDELLPQIDALSADDKRRLLEHLSAAKPAAKPKGPTVVRIPGPRGAVPQTVVIRGMGKQ